MAKTVSERAQRCRSFLRALAAGASVTEACKVSGIHWNTLYRWRRTDPEFRTAWDEAAGTGNDALAARFDGALVERAIDGVDEPVFHAGEQVATRKRYSDPLLMFGIRELRERRRPAAPPPVIIPPQGNQRITVIVRQFGPPDVPLPEETEDGE